ncbi:nucleotide-diphospho-sugar transferase [Wallemia mellicola]|uniref:Translation initiation factor eIF2B subunit epsilon n=1 Tax=Wallemia mellicola TaxID=1708541 RepID=A0A4T0PVJ4_9BASI|nr:nucleotide-diphospho-sugar transferase [Wallemia mellicola]TIC32907.1 nucleotide-diphospho-sugar transferase [Wallemia mellicola]
MPPNSKVENEDEEQGLQAIVFADSFNARFKPLTDKKPRCLLPLVNVPMLAWTLESLAAAGIRHVFLFTCTHADQIKEWLNQSRKSHFSSALSTLAVTPIVSTTSVSAGDAIRELDAKQLIRTDFVLISGDVVSTIDIQKIVDEHKERRKTNKDAIMTMVTKRVGASHRLSIHPRPPAESPVFVIDPSNNQLHSYTTLAHPSLSSGATHKRVNIPSEALEAAELQIRNDLADCYIDICSVDVLLLFTENFDYQDLRLDFINGILTSDLLGKTIHMHTIEDETGGYAGRVMDGRSYDAISKDIISRWTYPMVPDESMPDSERLHHQRGHRYFGKDNVQIGESASISVCSVIGSQSKLSDKSKIERSVIGQSVQIGESSRISHSYIWNKASIGNSCDISESIIAESARIGDQVIISNGCFVGENVTIASGTKLPPFTRVGTTRWNQEEEDEEDEAEKGEYSAYYMSIANVFLEERLKILGEESNGYLWPSDKVDMQIDEIDSDDEEDEDFQLSMKYSRMGARPPSPALSTSSSLSTISNGGSDEENDDDEDDINDAVEGLTLENAGKVGAAADFSHECVQSLERAFEEGHTSENAAIELKTLRMASNVQLSQVRKVVIDFCMSRISTTDGQPVKAVEAVFGRWAQLVIEMTKEDQSQAILIAQEYCARHPQSHLSIFLAVLRIFYEYEIASEETIFAWYKSQPARGESESDMRVLWEKSRRFIEALLEADSESEEEESD